MRMLAARTALLLVLALLFALGLGVFAVQYFNDASTWAAHPSNKHFYTEGELKSLGTVYDSCGRALLRMEQGSIRYNEDVAIRTALMHITGDGGNNVETAVSTAFRSRLIGWNLLNGAYRFDSERANLGQDITLTLDAALCSTAYRELGGHKGAVGVYNYRTGELICSASAPSFDPHSPPAWEQDPERYEGVFLNRLFSAAYPPGSVFKLVTAAAALEHLPDVENTIYSCSGKMKIKHDQITCLAKHGELILEEALARSCNVAFAQIALELGPERLQQYAEKAGFNSALQVDGIYTAAGKVNLAHADKAELAWAGAGQHTVTANPLNFMAYMGAIGNEGLLVPPTMLAGGGLLSKVDLKIKKRVLPESTAATLGEMMRNNTLTVYGESRFQGLELCAKSGTAEVGEGKRPHAWFAGFLAREDLPLAFVVVIEEGGSGGKSAAAVASKVLHAAARAAKTE